MLGGGKRLPCMNTIILNGADAELSETEHSPAHRRKCDLLVRNASRQGSAPYRAVAKRTLPVKKAENPPLSNLYDKARSTTYINSEVASLN